jgi:integration host factor subunit beta
MNKSDLIVALARDAEITRSKAEEIVNSIFETMSRALMEGDRIEIRGFGSFMVKSYKGYSGRNPKTGAKIEVKAKRLPFFKTGKGLRERTEESGL